MTLDRDRIVRALPSYEIGDEIGRGAWGIVVVARHRQLGRSVAVKELPAAFASDPGVRRRFNSEARLLAALDHPHIVPIYDYVEDEGLCLLVMELLAGGTVWSRFTTEGVSAAAACSIVVAACSALHHAHSSGVLHRDIKPENLLFSGSETLKVSDFGIAKVVGGAASMGTRTGEVLGTPAYMAPEQALGTDLTPATDVYALGTVLYELLSGRLPFADDGNAIALLYRHVHEDPKPLGELRPDLPPALIDVTMRSLARDPADRYATAEEFGVAVADAATAAWGAGWVRAGGVNVIATGRIGERISGSGPVSELPVTAPPGQRTRSSRVSETVADVPPSEAGIDADVGTSPEELVPLSEIVAAEAPGPSPDPAPPTVAAPAVPATPPPHIPATVAPTKRRSRLVIALGVLAAVVALAAAIVVLTRGDSSDQTASSTSSGGSSAAIDATVPVGSGIDHVAVGAGRVWVTNGDDFTIVAIDPSTNASTAAARLEVPPHAIIVVDGSLWLTTQTNQLLRVEPGNDPADATVTAIELASTSAELAAGEGAIWATLPQTGELVRVNPSRNQVVATIAVGDSPDSLAVGAGSVWVANRLASGNGTVTRIDPSNNQVVATIDVGVKPESMAFGADAVWVANSGDGTVSRIDPETNEVVATIPIGGIPQWVATEDDAVWVTNGGTSTVVHIDPETNEVVATKPVGSGAEASAIGEGAIWVVNHNDGTVSRVSLNG